MGAEPLTLSIPNVSNGHAERITRRLVEPSRNNWLAGCARSSTLGLLWGTGDRAVICSVPCDQFMVDDLQDALDVRLLVHQVPDDLTLSEAELDQLAQRLRTFDRGMGYRAVAWSATVDLSELVAGLRNRHVTVAAGSGPFTPHWSAEYLNSKIGLRHLVQRVGQSEVLRLPTGVVCTHLEQACEASAALLRAGHARVVLKADRAAGGFGQFLVPARVLQWDTRTREAFARIIPTMTPLLASSPIVAEAWIDHRTDLSATPSVMMELHDQGVDLVGTAATFMEFGTAHVGAMVGDGALPAPLESSVIESGLAVAQAAWAIGYRGPLSVDTVVDPEGRVFLLEINARRTMVSHCHDLRRTVFGTAGEGAVASVDSIRVGTGVLDGYKSVRSRLSAMWFQREIQSGVLITNFAPADEDHEDAWISLVALDSDATAAATLLRRALLTLGVAGPQAIASLA